MANQATNAVATVVLSEVAERQAEVAAHYDGAALPRLAALVDEAAKDAVGGERLAPDICARFSFAAHQAPKFVSVAVQIEGVCALPCQRCLELVPVKVAIDQRLAVGEDLDDAALEALETDYERWDHAGDSLALAELADELVLLDLPLVVMHAAPEACGALAGQLAADVADSGSQRPFEGLQDLMGGKDN